MCLLNRLCRGLFFCDVREGIFYFGLNYEGIFGIYILRYWKVGK